MSERELSRRICAKCCGGFWVPETSGDAYCSHSCEVRHLRDDRDYLIVLVRELIRYSGYDSNEGEAAVDQAREFLDELEGNSA